MDEGVVRMQAFMYGLVAEMYAVVAEVEGMKAENKSRENRGEAQAWPELSFYESQKRLDGIASALQTKI